jgi:hypothetical protein
MSAPSIDLRRNGKAAELRNSVAPRTHSEGPSLAETVLEMISTLAGIVAIMLLIFATLRLIV